MGDLVPIWAGSVVGSRGSFIPAVPGHPMTTTPRRPVLNVTGNYVSRLESNRARSYAHHVCNNCVVDNDNLVGRVSDLSYGLDPSDSFFIVGEVVGGIVWVGEWRFRGRLCFNSNDLCRPVAVRGWWNGGWVTVTLWEVAGGLISSAR
jgi:hypothetical protein